MEDLEGAIKAIDQANSLDPNLETVGENQQPKELIYSQRMADCLLNFCPKASVELQLSARAQHICRWKIPRASYPLGKIGYHQWRNSLKKFHAEKTEAILSHHGFGDVAIKRVKFLIEKKKLKSDPETQTLEDVICLVFLSHYLEAFAAKHPEEKVIDILQKTWGKMSEKGQEAALQLPLDSASLEMVNKALAG